jgi:hypothetical protein
LPDQPKAPWIGLPASRRTTKICFAGWNFPPFVISLKALNPANGLVMDRTRQGSPCTIAVVGFALSCYPVAVERGWAARADAALRTLATLRFFWNSPQNESPGATGYKGFYYHCLDSRSGRRVWQSELSLIDSTLLLAGILTTQTYFNGAAHAEGEIRTLAASLPADGLGVGAEQPAHRGAGVEARMRISALWLGGLQ